MRSFCFGYALAFTALISNLQATTDLSPAPTQAVMDFTQVAKEAIPAVVYIKVNGKTKVSSARSLNALNPRMDIFGDDFLRKFFGIPEENNDNSSESTVLIQASGFIISADGNIITNSHVVKEPGEITVVLNDGRELPGKVLGQDPNTDIAVIKVEAENLPYLTFANSDDLKVGQWAIAIGSPFSLQATLTVGVVSATGRNNLDITQVEDFIQTDAAINRGNSGGPLLNINGKVIGMNTAIVTNNLSGYMGIGFAIPSNMITHIVHDILTTGKVTRGFMGVLMQPLDANLVKSFGLEKNEGVLVADVTKDSPAEVAGLKQGDVIVKYNGNPVTSISALKSAIAVISPGKSVVLTVIRDGKPMDISVTLGDYPTETKVTQEEEVKENKYGFAVEDLTPALAQSLGYKEEKGVVISSVKPNSVAALAGLKKGILILAVSNNRVSSVADFNKEMDAVPAGKPLLLLVRYGSVMRFVSIMAN